MRDIIKSTVGSAAGVAATIFAVYYSIKLIERLENRPKKKKATTK